MFLIAGLGNHGNQYQNTRHNIGFHIIDELANHYNIDNFSLKYQALYAKNTIDSYDVILVKPQTYMNRSGIAIMQLKEFFKISISDIIVIHDDLDLKPGIIRSKIGGGSAGHKGINSIDQMVGKSYKRIRAGIGRPVDHGLNENIDIADYVLGKTLSTEQEHWEVMTQHILDNITNYFTE